MNLHSLQRGQGKRKINGRTNRHGNIGERDMRVGNGISAYRHQPMRTMYCRGQPENDADGMAAICFVIDLRNQRPHRS